MCSFGIVREVSCTLSKASFRGGGWSKRAPFDYEKMAFQLVESSGPAVLVSATDLVVVQARVGEGELGPVSDGAEPELDKRLAGILDTARPAPRHDQPLGFHDVDIFAAALVLAAIEHTEAYPEAAANLRVDLRREHGTGIRSPPIRDAFNCSEGVEDDRWPGLDPAHKRKACHRLFFLASASLRLAQAARRSRLCDQNRS